MLIAHVTVTVILVTINLQFVCLSPHTSGYNEFHNILRLFNVLPNFPFTTSETMGDYYLQTWYIRVAERAAERLKTYELWKLGNIRKVSKLHRMIA